MSQYIQQKMYVFRISESACTFPIGIGCFLSCQLELRVVIFRLIPIVVVAGRAVSLFGTSRSGIVLSVSRGFMRVRNASHLNLDLHC